ncbi:ASKHA domain-containing protein [Chloroflexota bacterium]
MPESNLPGFLVIFQPSGRRGGISGGKTIMEAAQELGVEIESVCGGRGTCGKCKVQVSSEAPGSLSPISGAEKKMLSPQQRREGYRLACQARIHGDVMVFIPEESRMVKQVVRKEAGEVAVALKPAVRQYRVKMAPPTLDDTSADWERLRAEVSRKVKPEALAVDAVVLPSLPDVLRRRNWEVTVSVWMGREVIRVEPGAVDGSYGMAVDIGTTTVAAYLCDLTTGELVATSSMVNPQVAYGEDVLARISSCDNNRGRLHKAIINGINQLAGEAAAGAGIRRRDIVDITVVGNTCMHHLFLNINPYYLGRSPFSPGVSDSLDIKARDLGLRVSPGAYVHVLPVEAGFVGADNVGVLLATGLHRQDDMVLAIDIGTNGEVVLGNRNRLVSCSCATGPAFEGAQIRYGMRAAPGAIEQISIASDTREVRFKVIGREGWNTDLDNAGARGICGSGIIDAAAQLFLAGVIGRTGRFNVKLDTPRLRVVRGEPEFVIAWARETSLGQDIVVSAGDIRNIQLAKGAMYAGAKILMRRLAVDKVDKIILAGAFGTYIDKEAAAVIGLFPDCAGEKVAAVGNAAGDGARIALLNVDKRTEAGKVARQVEYVELAAEPDFTRLFSQAMWFPHMKDSFPSLRRLSPQA